jgi:hypothetical protein
MDSHTHRAGLNVFVAVVIASAGLAVVVAQDGPVAAMFRDDLKRESALSASFLPIELGRAESALHVYLSAGDLARAFDGTTFRPDAAIVPTNAGLVVTAASPATQRVLIERIQKVPSAMANLQDQIAVRRKQGAGSSGDGNVLEISVDAFVAKLQGKDSASGAGAFPRLACLIATDFPTGGAVDRRELFSQDRVRKGVAACLSALDAAGATSVIMPLLGAASAQTQSKDAVFEGQRLLKECRHLNAAAGIALGIHDFMPGRRTLREIGVVQWDQEIRQMFNGSRLAQTAYRLYAEQIKHAVNKGIAGGKTTASDIGGNCSATFGA